MRLINAEDIKKRADCYPLSVRSVVANILSHTKTVKDAVKVVRCKDCKYWHPKHRYCEGIGNWFENADSWSENGFCYKGEKREDETD